MLHQPPRREGHARRARGAGGRAAARAGGEAGRHDGRDLRLAFKPATLKTTVGKTVTWRNADAAPHTATAAQFSSPQLAKGASYKRRFTRAGTYTYLCALHPGMKGKIVVGGGRADGSPPVHGGAPLGRGGAVSTAVAGLPFEARRGALVAGRGRDRRAGRPSSCWAASEPSRAGCMREES